MGQEQFRIACPWRFQQLSIWKIYNQITQHFVLCHWEAVPSRQWQYKVIAVIGFQGI